LQGVPFPLHLIRQVFTNEDGSTGVRYLVASDLTLDANQIIAIYQAKRAGVLGFSHSDVGNGIDFTRA
jgi:hypothetical protein